MESYRDAATVFEKVSANGQVSPYLDKAAHLADYLRACIADAAAEIESRIAMRERAKEGGHAKHGTSAKPCLEDAPSSKQKPKPKTRTRAKQSKAAKQGGGEGCCYHWRQGGRKGQVER